MGYPIALASDVDRTSTFLRVTTRKLQGNKSNLKAEEERLFSTLHSFRAWFQPPGLVAIALARGPYCTSTAKSPPTTDRI
jgi:hypothetical protein